MAQSLCLNSISLVHVNVHSSRKLVQLVVRLDVAVGAMQGRGRQCDALLALAVCVSRYPVASPGRGTALHPSAPSLLFFLLFFLSFYCRCCDFSIKRKRRWSDWHKSKVKRGKGDSVESLRGFVCTIKVPRTSYLSWKTVDKV